MRRKGSFWAGILLVLLLAACGPDTQANDYAQADLSCLKDGVVRVRYTGEGEARVKCQITRTEGTDYNYDLNTRGDWEQFTLTEGEGEYVLRVLENVEGEVYRPVFRCELSLELEDPLAPFRQANQFVFFTEDSLTARVAGELAEGLETEEEKTGAVFDYVVQSLTYDGEKAATVEPGYLPDGDAVLEEGKGICVDYGVVMAAMLRSQGIPCRLGVGYAGEVYHAWVETPEGEGWRIWDPTFVSANGGDPEILDFVSDGENYRARYYY